MFCLPVPFMVATLAVGRLVFAAWRPTFSLQKAGLHQNFRVPCGSVRGAAPGFQHAPVAFTNIAFGGIIWHCE